MSRPGLFRSAVRRRSVVPAALASGLAVISLSNVALHPGIDESAGVEWAAIHRMPEPSLTVSQGIRHRYGLFFSLREIASSQTVLEIPSNWDGAEQERQFDEFLRPVILGVSDIQEVVTSTDLHFGDESEWWESSLEELRADGLVVSEGRSRPNGRQPWYVWRVVSASDNPANLRLLVTAENEYLFLDSRIERRS